jgi:hypothetical protein
MAATRIRFVEAAADVPDPSPDALVVVLDPAWTPTPGERPDLVSARRLLGDVVERIDCYDRALELVDAWAEATGIADRLFVEDTTYWFRMRETMWRWVHERLLWRHALVGLDVDGEPREFEVPIDEAALDEVAKRLWPGSAHTQREPGDGGSKSDTGPLVAAPVARAGPDARAMATGSGAIAPAERGTSSFRRLSRAVLQPFRPAPPPPKATERDRRERTLADRVTALVQGSTPRVLVLTNPATHQRVGGPEGDRVDPLFGAIIPRLGALGMQPVLLGTGLDQRQDEDWSLIQTDDRLLPQFLLRTRWSKPEDDERAERALTTATAAIETLRGTPLDVDGVDLGAEFIDALVAATSQVIRSDVHTLARVERLIAEIAPRAIVLAQEGIRTPWLMAARRAGIPIFAVQHGVLYAGHPGYPNRRHPALCLPARTFVYGDYERNVLLAPGAYLPDEVETSGSPRLDLDTAPADPGAERRDVRRELGVADGDRLLVVSTVNLRFVRRSHIAHMLEAVLGGPLPGVHVVFKQHPGERDEGPYRDLLVGLARAGGYEPPPLAVVKDVDLYRLLRAADAHLGLLSTVLTDAVAAGTPNLIGLTDRHADLLGYADAGVARYVRTPAELLEALAEPSPPDPAARAAFLADHFAGGDASERIATEVAAATSRTGTPV